MTSAVVTLADAVSVITPDGARHRPPGAQVAAVLALLALEHRRPVRQDEIAEVLWPEVLPVHWKGAVRGLIARLRAFLAGLDHEVATIRTAGGWVELDLAEGSVVDLEVAQADLATAEAAVTAGDWPRAREAAGRARDVLARPVLAGHDGEWADRLRSRYDGLHRRASHLLLDAQLACGDHADAVATAAVLLDRDPFDEESARAAIRANARLGRTAEAAAVYERLEAALGDELGVRPAPDTEAVYREALQLRPPATTAPAEPVVHGRGALGDRLAFVGRRSELGLLDDAHRAALACGSLRVLLVEGEAGIGKTRLLEEWAERLAAPVLWGRCSGARVAFEPLTEALASRAELRQGTGFRVASAPEDRALRTERFEATRDALRSAIRDGTHVLVIDDLHDADDDTCELLLYVASTLRTEPLMLAGTLRRQRLGPVVGRLVAELHRAGARSISLGGLTRGEVRTLIANTGGMPSEAAGVVAASVHERTGGNALYVTHLVADALVGGHRIEDDHTPRALQQLLDRRVAALDRGARDVLALAAVAGPDVDAQLVASCSRLDPLEVADTLDELCTLGFLVPQGAERFRFAHDLVRRAVTVSLSPARAGALHHRVASALEGRAPHAVLAEHYRLAGWRATREAAHHTLAAAGEALAESAWGLAETLLRSIERSGLDPDQQVQLAIGLGRSLRGQGKVEESRAELESALALADARGLARPRAEATLALIGGGGRGVGVDLADPARARLLRHALGDLDDVRDADLAVPLLGELATALLLTPRTLTERRRLVERALAIAERTGDPAARAVALNSRRCVHVDATCASRRLADARRVLAMAPDALPADARLAALVGQVEDHLVLDQLDCAAGALEEAWKVAQSLDDPYWLWSVTTWRGLEAIVRGDLHLAEEFAGAALGHQPTNPEAVAAFGVQLVCIRLYQRRGAEVVDLVARAAADNPHIPAYQAVLALCCAHAGDSAGARRHLGELAQPRLRGLPPDSNRFLAVAVLADAALTVGATEFYRPLLRALGPYDGLRIVLNCYGGGGATWGLVRPILDRLGD